MPPSAAATLPSVRLAAVECAPGADPYSSFSISSPGKAPQFSSTNGPLARRLLSWISLASWVLPDPDGPVISTLICSGATIATCFSSSAIAALAPTTESPRKLRRCAWVGSPPSSSSSRLSRRR